jgi:hypothetical protein
MVRIAVISSGNPYFSDLESVLSPLLYTALIKEGRREHKNRIEKLLTRILEPYVEFAEVDETDILDNMCKLLQPSTEEELKFNCEPSYGYSKGFNEVFYKISDDESIPINAIGCYHSLSHSIIRGKCLIIANRFMTRSNEKTEIIRADIEMKDLVRVIRRRFYRSAILVDGEMMAKYYYQTEEYLIESIFGEGTDVKSENVSFLNHSIGLSYRMDNQGIVNNFATRILGKTITGPVIFQLYLERLCETNIDRTTGNYDNLTERCLKRFNLLAYGDMHSRNVKSTELPEEYRHDEACHWCRYYYLENRMLVRKLNPPVCANCKGQLGTKQYTCPITRRYKYCSADCARAEHI